MGRPENLAVHALEQTKKQVEAQLTTCQKNMTEKELELTTLENDMLSYIKDYKNLEQAISKLKGELNVKSTSKNKKA